ncbi:unnamed protein product [Ostreobium quekettii]|uniref:Calcineurin-like phosphoesterase domain-containing protein n=1 Tax=Ostreobium quekettii TaxID=121088 RepID=A0A8S1J599_9CHLO|nr:unnamed protein product [Ostreobium quekettii]
MDSPCVALVSTWAASGLAVRCQEFKARIRAGRTRLGPPCHSFHGELAPRCCSLSNTSCLAGRQPVDKPEACVPFSAFSKKFVRLQASRRGVVDPVLMAANSEGTCLAVVGDVHGFWNDADELAVKFLMEHSGVDLTLFIGDIGNNANIALVSKIAKLIFPKAVVLGNHDAWPPKSVPIFSREQNSQNHIVPQLRVLGEAHVGFSSMRVANKPVTVVGARPFTEGGVHVYNMSQFYNELYGMETVDEYTKKVSDLMISAPPDDAIVVMGHNGPSGLGSRRWDICGIDWKQEEGDHGDPDLRAAIDRSAQQGRRPALVTFGHMHEKLSRRVGRSEKRRRVVVEGPHQETVHLNAAVVPRIRPLGGSGHPAHHFCVVRIERGRVVTAEDVWVEIAQERRPPCRVVHTQRLCQWMEGPCDGEGSGEEGQGHYAVYDTHGGGWTDVEEEVGRKVTKAA